MSGARLYRKVSTLDKDFNDDDICTQFNKSLINLYGTIDTYHLPTLEEALREAKFQQSELIAKECIRQAQSHQKNIKSPTPLTLEDISVLTLFFGGSDSIYFDYLNYSFLESPPSQNARGLLILLLIALRKLPVCTQPGPLVSYSSVDPSSYREGTRKFWDHFVSAVDAFQASGLVQSQQLGTAFIIEGDTRCYNVGAFFMRDDEYIFEPGTAVRIIKKIETVVTTEMLLGTTPILQDFIASLTTPLFQMTSPMTSPSSSLSSQQKSPMLPPGNDNALLSRTFLARSIHWNGCILSWAPVNFSLQPQQSNKVVYQISRPASVFTQKHNAIVYEGTETTVEHTGLEPEMSYEFYLRYGILQSDGDDDNISSTSSLLSLPSLRPNSNSNSNSNQQPSIVWSKWTVPLKVKTPKLYVNIENVAFHIEFWHTAAFDIKIPTLITKKMPDGGKHLLKYHVVQNLKGENAPTSQIFDTSRITLRNLLPDSEYDVKVRVARANDDKWSPFTAFNMLTLKLQPPPGFAASARHWHKIRLTWGTPAGCDDKAVLYTVELKMGDNMYTPLYEGFAQSFSYEDLSPETEYVFRAAATLDNKRSDWIEASARTPTVSPFENARWKECPESIADSSRGYVIGGARGGEVATFLGTDCAVVLYETLIPQNMVVKWGVRVRRFPEGVGDSRGLWFGVAPYNVDQSMGWRNLERAGWYFWCGGGSAARKVSAWSTPMLFSGPPHNYKRVPYGEGKVRSCLKEGDVVVVEMDTVCGDLSFVIKGEDCASGPAYTGIPLDVPLVPVVNITRKNTSVEFVSSQFL